MGDSHEWPAVIYQVYGHALPVLQERQHSGGDSFLPDCVCVVGDLVRLIATARNRVSWDVAMSDESGFHETHGYL